MSTTEDLMSALSDIGSQQHEDGAHEGEQSTCETYPCPNVRELSDQIDGETYEDACNIIENYTP
jgi:hypothetical protein